MHGFEAQSLVQADPPCCRRRDEAEALDEEDASLEDLFPLDPQQFGSQDARDRPLEKPGQSVSADDRSIMELYLDWGMCRRDLPPALQVDHGVDEGLLLPRLGNASFLAGGDHIGRRFGNDIESALSELINDCCLSGARRTIGGLGIRESISLFK